MKLTRFKSFLWGLIPGLLLCGCIRFDIPEGDTDSTEYSSSSEDMRPTDDDSDSDSGEITETEEDTTRGTSSSTSEYETDDTGTGSDNYGDTNTSTPTDSDTSSDTVTDSDTDETTDTQSDTMSDLGTDTPTTEDTETNSETDSSTTADTGSEIDTDTEVPIPIEIDTESVGATRGFDSRPIVVPTLSDTGGSGNVAAIGELADPTPSSGGACNSGVTQIYNYAAINLHHESGDTLGQWADGRICGQCAKVAVETADGITTTIVRIVDKCADDLCGILLGAQAANDVMNGHSGKYWGGWRFVPCNGDERVSDGPPAIYVKEGSSDWWSQIQIRNAPAAVLSIQWESANNSGEFEVSTEAQNFFNVPVAVLQTTGTVTLTMNFDFDITIVHQLKGTALAEEDTLIVLTAPDN